MGDTVPCKAVESDAPCQRDGDHGGWHAWYTSRRSVAWRGSNAHAGDDEQYVEMIEALAEARRLGGDSDG